MDEATIKAAVRDRDGYACTDCGMTNDRHIERFGRSLDVHRTEAGSQYAVDGCVTLCRSCHCKKPKTLRRKRVERVPLGARLRLSTLAKLDAAAERLDMSRSGVVEILARAAHQITPEMVAAANLPKDHRGKRGQGRRKK
jgi:hypothetical protein